MPACQPYQCRGGHSQQHHCRREEAMMACQSAPCQQTSRDRLHKAKTSNIRNISAAFQERKKRINLEVECRHKCGQTPGKTPKDRWSRMLVRGKEIKANRNQGRGQEYSRYRIPTN